MLHDIVITCPDGRPHSAEVTIDGQPMRGVLALRVELDAGGMFAEVTLKLAPSSVRITGLAGVNPEVVIEDNRRLLGEKGL